MLKNQVKLIQIYCLITAFIGITSLFQSKAYAQDTPIKTIQEIYSFYQPGADNETDDIGFDRTGLQSSHFLSPDFLRVIKEDDKLTSAQGDASIIDYDFICNCDDNIDGILIRNIQILQQTDHTAKIKVSFDFTIDGSDTLQMDGLFPSNPPGQQQTYFNLILFKNHWLIDDITDANNVGIKKRWKEELRKDYNSSIQ